MHFTKKIDRAFQWAGEKMGSEARTAHSDEFKNLEAEMSLRYDGTYNHIVSDCDDSNKNRHGKDATIHERLREVVVSSQ